MTDKKQCDCVACANQDLIKKTVAEIAEFLSKVPKEIQIISALEFVRENDGLVEYIDENEFEISSDDTSATRTLH